MKQLLSVLIVCVCAGCVKAPEIVMVDRATALEQEASGSFDDLERKLDRAGIEPDPVPLTPEQLRALGIQPAPLVDASELTDADRVDGFLLQHCVGEGKDGLIVDTHEACEGAADADELAALVGRVNAARRQLWRWMHERRTDIPEDELQRAWRERHLENVVCGGWVEQSDGTWRAKAC